MGDNLEKVVINELRIDELPLSHTWVIVGPPSSGKTSFMINIVFYNKHKYPVGKVTIQTEDGYKHFKEIFHPLFVSNSWDEIDQKRFIERQRKCVLEHGKGYIGNYAINIIDDVGDDPKIYKTKLMRALYKLGSQHWEKITMIGTQFALDLPPDIRNSLSYAGIGRSPDPTERKKLYNNFGGTTGSFEKFEDLMDQLTGDHTFMIIKKRSQSNKLEDCVFFWQTKVLGPWKFGCNEYRAHGEARYNPNYVEQIDYDL